MQGKIYCNVIAFVDGTSMVCTNVPPALKQKRAMVETKTNHASINLEVLDAAVTRYLLEEELIDSDAASSTEEMDAEVRQALHLFLTQKTCPACCMTRSDCTSGVLHNNSH